MDLNTLLILNEVIRLKSFSKAATVLGMPSSNVSRKVQSLEQQLGLKLVQRSTRSVTATSEGLTVIKLAQGLYDSNQQIQEWLLGQTHIPQGQLTITAPESFAQWPLSDWLLYFKQQYPDIDIELLSDSRQLSFDDYALDFAFRFGQLQDSNLIAKVLATVEFGFYASAGFLKNNGPIESIIALKAAPSIACITEQGTLPFLYKQKSQALAYTPNASFKVKDQLIALKACQKHIGIAFFPKALVAHHDKRHVLKPILEKHWPAPMPLYLLYRNKQSTQALRHKVFIDFLVKQYKAAGMV